MKIFAVLGNPIGHSLSPQIHNYVIKKLQLDAIYIKLLLPLDINSGFLRKFLLDSDIDGVNITIPFKEVAFNATNQNIGISQQAQAINTILKNDGNLIGYNTDVLGFQKCLEKYSVKSALIIGAGGSARSVAIALKTMGVKSTIVNRSSKKLDFFKSYGKAILSKDIEIRQYDVIVNATSASLSNILPLEKAILKNLFLESKLVFDLAYLKDETIFCSLARECNIQCLDGRDMLIIQGAMSFIYFHKLDIAMLDNIVSYMRDSLI